MIFLSTLTADTEHLIPKEVKPVEVKEMTVEERVQDFFKDIPELSEVAFCESTYRHYDEEGNVLRGEITPKDVGVMQINETFHITKAEELGYDIHTLEGNLAYAKWLYEKEGLRPWRASQKCWNQRIAMNDIGHAKN